MTPDAIRLYPAINFAHKPPRMLSSLLLIFDPANTWERIEKAQHGIARVFAVTVLPLLLIVTAVEAYSLITFGRVRNYERLARPLSVELVIRFETAAVVLNLLLLFGGAWLVKLMAEGFHRRHTYQQAFVTVAYSLTPLFLWRALNAIPNINLWITWGIGILLAISVLYRGLPRTMKPDPSNALGLYIMAALVLVLASGLSNYLQILVLEEKILAPSTVIIPQE